MNDMDKILGNFLTQANKDFPLDCETLEYMQTLAALACMVGNMGGDKVVLYGCEKNIEGTRRGEGYVFIRTKAAPQGEVMRWEGGVITSGMYVKQEDIKVSANNTDYPKAYTRRSLAPGIGAENFSWEEFTEIKTVKELMAEDEKLRTEMVGLKPAPPGIIQMWAGAKVPEGYLLCDGQQLRATEYPELYAALGTAFNTAVSASGQKYTTQAEYFRVPDLRGRFVVGQSDTESDYMTIGTGGGKKKIALTEAELPKHTHEVKDYYFAVEGGGAIGNYEVIETNNKIGAGKTDYDNDRLQYIKHDTESTGDGETFDNRPPYYVLAYIIKAI